MHLNGQASDPPVPVGMGVADLVTGLNIVYAVLAGVIARGRTGRGQRLETDLLSSLIAFQAQEVGAYLASGRLPQRSDGGVSSPSTGAPYGLHRTTDGFLAIAMTPLKKLGDLIGLEGLESSEGLNDLSDRDATQRRIAAVIATRSTQEWLDLLLAADVWCAPVQDYAAMAADPQVVHNGTLVSFDHPLAGTITVPGPSVRFDDTPAAVRRRPPLLGEHGDEILRDVVGLDDEAIAALRASGALGTAPANG